MGNKILEGGLDERADNTIHDHYNGSTSGYIVEPDKVQGEDVMFYVT